MSVLYKALAVVLALVALALGVRYTLHLRDEVQVLEARAEQAEKALKRSQATLLKREKDRAATARLVARARTDTEAVLRQNQPWADQPVPQEVQDALCKTLPCRGRTDGPSGLPDSPNTAVSP